MSLSTFVPQIEVVNNGRGLPWLVYYSGEFVGEFHDLQYNPGLTSNELFQLYKYPAVFKPVTARSYTLAELAAITLGLEKRCEFLRSLP